MNPIPLSLYIHIPWCVRKCPYCDFNSHQAQEIPEQDYVTALLEDLKQDTHLADKRPLRSIFFGGGTPSLFSAKSIGKILEGVNQQLTLSDHCEITLETNPGTTEYADFDDLKSTGVNRISFGIQSFNDTQLNALGRIHNSDQALNAFHKARKAGFSNINLDLMHGLPQQTLALAEQDLTTAIALAPEHISWYQLTIEPNTAFYKNTPSLPSDDTLVDIYDHGLNLLHHAGFEQYEVSAFSKPGKQSRHNLNYWQFGDYLAIGAGAHGKITGPNKTLRRYWKTRTPKDYLDPAKPFVAGTKPIEPEQQLLEYLMNTLRLKNGVDIQSFTERTEQPLQSLNQALAPLQEKGLIRRDSNILCTTALGYQFLNSVLEQIE